MARIRTIKPAFWASEALATRLPGPDGRHARLLFIGLWGLAEDLTGVLRGHPALVRSELFAYDDDVTADDVGRWLGLLEAGGFIVRYERNASAYVWIRGFVEHQKINRPSTSTLPEPSDAERTGRAEPSRSPHGALTEPSLPEVVSSKGREEEGRTASQEPANAVPERPDLVLTEQPAGKKQRTQSAAERLYASLQEARQERCAQASVPYVPDRWDNARQNKNLGPLARATPDNEHLQRAWELFLADDEHRAREPPWSLAYFLSAGVRAKYETRASREAA